jgi:hypothetical protein
MSKRIENRRKRGRPPSQRERVCLPLGRIVFYLDSDQDMRLYKYLASQPPGYVVSAAKLLMLDNDKFKQNHKIEVGNKVATHDDL